MRRVVIESPTEEVARFLGVGPLLSQVESFEVVKFLKDTLQETAMVCRVVLKDPSSKFELILRGSSVQTQLLDRDEGGARLYFVRIRRRTVSSLDRMRAAGGYFAGPFEVKDGKVRVGFVGSADQVRKTIKRTDKSGIPYKVVSLTDARFPPDSPLRYLSDKQREVLITAYKCGYYDLPKRISSAELAKRFNVRSSTLVRHRIKAEKRLLAALLEVP